MDKILNLNNVDLYNQIYGLETLHPLVTVIDLNKATRQMTYTHWNYGVYALYLKLEKACDIKYGRQTYDYQEGTVVCFAPGQTTETTLTTDRVQLNVLGILFHPDLLHGTSLGKTIKKYTFFSYEVNEALHLSAEERSIIEELLKIIRMELEHGIDKHSKTLLVNHIELLLNYCMRFYERQFTTRSKANSDVLTRFENLLNEYFEAPQTEQDGLPTVKYFADKLYLSSNYFGDMLKKRNRKKSTGIYSGKNHRTGKGTDLSYRKYSQPDCIFFGLPVPTTPMPVIQETSRLYPQ